jgi:hypothetical protein
MKRMVERIGPLVPAFATVGASVCVSSLLLTTGRQALVPQPLVPPVREVGRVVAALPPPAQRLSRGQRPATRSAGLSRGRRPATRAAGHRIAPARESAAPTPNSHASSRRVRRVGARAAPPPSPPSRPPTSVTPQPTSEPAAQAPAEKGKRPKDRKRPGWGNGDRNHDHTGPPGNGSEGELSRAKTARAGPPVAADDQHGSSQNGAKKSPRH